MKRRLLGLMQKARSAPVGATRLRRDGYWWVKVAPGDWARLAKARPGATHLTGRVTRAEALAALAPYGGGRWDPVLLAVVPNHPERVLNAIARLKRRVAVRIGATPLGADRRRWRNDASSVDELHRDAREAAAGVERATEKLATTVGGFAAYGPGGSVKDAGSLRSKATDRHRQPSRIEDAARSSVVVVRDVSDVGRVVRAAVREFGAESVSVDNKFADGRAASYAAVHLHLLMTTPSGRVVRVEIQVHHESIYDGSGASPKEQAHRLFKMVRSGSAHTERADAAQSAIWLAAINRVASSGRIGKSDGTMDPWAGPTPRSQGSTSTVTSAGQAARSNASSPTAHGRRFATTRQNCDEISFTTAAHRETVWRARCSSTASSSQQIAKGRAPSLTQPTRKRAKHPFQATCTLHGLTIDIENRRGTYRPSKDGKHRNLMRHHYGEVRGTRGVDRDPVDVYIGPDAASTLVVVVHQNDPTTGKYDEDKCMLGFSSERAAVAAYRKQYDRPGFYGGHTAMSIGEFKRKLRTRRGEMIKARLVAALRKARKLPPPPEKAPPGGGWQPLAGDLFGGMERHGEHWWPSVGHAHRAAEHYSQTPPHAVHEFDRDAPGMVGGTVMQDRSAAKEMARRLRGASRFMARKMRGRDVVKSGWLLLPEPYGAQAFAAQLQKGAGHKYIKRVPYTDAKGRRRYRYYYNVGHGRGVHHGEHFVEGAAFQHEGGHYHITKVHADGTVTIRHDETGETHRVRKDVLAAKLTAHHGEALQKYVGKLKELHRESKEGSHAKRRWAKRLEHFGHAAGSGEADKLRREIERREKYAKKIESDRPSIAASIRKEAEELKAKLAKLEAKPKAEPKKPAKASKALDSSNLKRVSLDGDKMTVEFKNGSVYEYDGVTREQYDAIANAESAGKAYNAFRKERGRGTSTKVKDGEGETKPGKQSKPKAGDLQDKLAATVKELKQRGRSGAVEEMLAKKKAREQAAAEQEAKRKQATEANRKRAAESRAKAGAERSPLGNKAREAAKHEAEIRRHDKPAQDRHHEAERQAGIAVHEALAAGKSHDEAKRAAADAYVRSIAGGDVAPDRVPADIRKRADAAAEFVHSSAVPRMREYDSGLRSPDALEHQATEAKTKRAKEDRAARTAALKEAGIRRPTAAHHRAVQALTKDLKTDLRDAAHQLVMVHNGRYGAPQGTGAAPKKGTVITHEGDRYVVEKVNKESVRLRPVGAGNKPLNVGTVTIKTWKLRKGRRLTSIITALRRAA